MNTVQPANDLHRAETVISHLLRWGVLLSLLTIILGIVITFLQHPDYLTSHDLLGPLLREHPASGSLIAGAGGWGGPGVIVLGLLMLICTPVLRVAASIFIFAGQKNRAFVIITLLVLITLLVSFFLGKVE